MSVNASLFNELVGIYTELGKPVPHHGRPDLKGSKRTAALHSLIATGRHELSAWRQRQLQQQMIAAQQAMRSQLAALNKPKSQPNVLKSTLSQSDSGVRGRRSRQQLRAQEQGLRAANQLQSGPYLGPQGSPSASPYGSSINLA